MARKPLSQVLNGVTRFGRLEVLAEAKPRPRQGGGVKRYALCRCDCGAITEVHTKNLKSGDTTSCGCFYRQSAGARIEAISTTHGLSKKAPEYYVWCSLKQRCLNPNVRNFHDYGGRGITVCERWRNSFEAFYADMGPRPTPTHSIDRIDGNGNYEPSNCRWASAKEQSENRRWAITVEFNGEHLPLKIAAGRANLKYSTVRARLKKGVPASRLLDPVR